LTTFRYVGGMLAADGVPMAEIAAAVGTPCYVYSASAMREQARAFRGAFAAERALICYAVKANSNLAVVRLFASEGLGADTVSGGEIARALAAGVPPQRIVYAGIAKTDDEIRMALATGIL
jgi:diaminopimelate decarboxylase